MRIPHKVVCLWSCLTAFTFIHTAVAQDYSVQPLSSGYVGSAVLEDESQDPYGEAAYYPTAYQDGGMMVPDPSAAGYPPAMMGNYPPALAPPNASYWPNVSPYDPSVMDKTYRQNGIWMHDPVYGNRSYAFALEYLRVGFNRPGSDTIGARDVVSSPVFGSGYNAVNTKVFANGNDFLSDGLRGKFIIQNADSSTLEMSGWWVAESNSVFHPFQRADPTDTTTLKARGFLGLDNGTPEGLAVPFDTDFKLGYKQQAFGGDLLWSAMPFFETTGFRIRPVFGLKYLKIREQFTLHGEDSALAYAYDPIDGTPIGPVLPNPFGNPAYSADLTSRTKSDLAGPQAGIRYELGGQKFLLSGQTGFGLMANHEAVQLFGNQIGDGFFTGFPQPSPANPKPAAFHDGRSNTHVSPVFTQDFNFKGKVFKHLPFFNDIPLFANADMLVGYNFLLVGNVARPTKLIDWRANDPRIDLTHSRWFMQAATFGLQWSY